MPPKWKLEIRKPEASQANLNNLAMPLDRIHDHKINRLDELLPWNWVPLASATDSQAA
jgi:hypothetical protein|tara:strand:+ start:5998 stop:6171 length:174 start_codon:yes stop_codon:yes gene_type:complete